MIPQAKTYDDERTPDENVARALCSIADSLHGIGLGDLTPGTLEYIGMGLRDLVGAVSAIADAITNSE